MRRAQRAYAEVPDAVAALEREVERMDAPLQVALAGKLKAGKSTLLNALLGVELAASDHAECTRVLTWYRWAATPAVTVHPVRGEPWSSPPRRGPQGLQIDLRGRSAADVDRIEVAWPAPGLVRTTLVDTPGLDSLSRDVSERTREFLTRADAESAVDAVVYLMRHLHATDVRFLESFGAGRSGRGAAPGTVAVLSRADEVGVGRIDAMIAAGRVAERYRSDPALRPVCQTVVPVAGLLGLTGQTLREEEVADLRALAALDRSVTDGLMLSVDRFRRPSLGLPVAAPARAGLLARFGLFGVRLALTLLRNRGLPAAALAAELERRSGLTELRRVLDAQLTARRDTLRAQGALRTLTRLLAEHPVPDARALAADCERLTLAAHGARELDGLGMLRSQGLDLAPDVLVAAERLLGAQGDRPTDRLGLPPDTTPGRSRRRRGGPGTSGSTEVPTPWRTATRGARAGWWCARARCSSTRSAAHGPCPPEPAGRPGRKHRDAGREHERRVRDEREACRVGGQRPRRVGDQVLHRDRDHDPHRPGQHEGGPRPGPARAQHEGEDDEHDGDHGHRTGPGEERVPGALLDDVGGDRRVLLDGDRGEARSDAHLLLPQDDHGARGGDGGGQPQRDGRDQRGGRAAHVEGRCEPLPAEVRPCRCGRSPVHAPDPRRVVPAPAHVGLRCHGVTVPGVRSASPACATEWSDGAVGSGGVSRRPCRPPRRPARAGRAGRGTR